MKKLLIIGMILGYPIYSIANTPCDYDYKINSEYTKTIELITLLQEELLKGMEK